MNQQPPFPPPETPLFAYLRRGQFSHTPRDTACPHPVGQAYQVNVTDGMVLICTACHETWFLPVDQVWRDSHYTGHLNG
jgi:hypothetical protein